MITKEDLKRKVDLIFLSIQCIHHPCGMPHEADQGCTKEAMAELAWNAYQAGIKEGANQCGSA